MTQATLHIPTPFFVGIIISDMSIWKSVKDLILKWGDFVLSSEEIDFDSFTQYYEPEMSCRLTRFWAAFDRLRTPDELIDIKLSVTEIENSYAIDGKRRVNIDPGYLTEAKIVLASFKDFSHRLYLGNGVYADIQLMYRNGKYEPMPWTFPDYKCETAQSFFLDLRRYYRTLLKKEHRILQDNSITNS